MKHQTSKWLPERFIDDDVPDICVRKHEKNTSDKNSRAAATLPHQRRLSSPPLPPPPPPASPHKIWIWWYPSFTPKISRRMPDKCPDIYQSTISFLSCFFSLSTQLLTIHHCLWSLLSKCLPSITQVFLNRISLCLCVLCAWNLHTDTCREDSSNSCACVCRVGAPALPDTG